eukprot:CAMPEP_0179437222 /NCGR_PEP_ID=MMETSP0799-20121207/21157_1 /TAXON_ID=46947 /ORGANISM="Geminigera cryophila, Strain CCMP2564" /LENGTH=267 /DNA_ID=CAMNT_0021218027 /DNA_START=8 /DNA_END=811 /DNA_ORIENTATION=+
MSMGSRSFVLLGLAAAAEAFSPAGLPGLRSPGTALHAGAACNVRVRKALVAPKMQSDDEPKVIWDAGADFKSDSQRMKEATGGMQMRDESGNVDTPDYFDDNTGGVMGAGSTGFKDGAAAAGGTGGNKLKSMLSADNTEVREVEKFKSGKEVQFVAHKWKIDGDFASGDPTFALAYNVANKAAVSSFQVEPNSMTYEDFVAGFTDDTPPGWSVEPTEGTIERRGGAPQPFTVKYAGGQPDGPTPGTLVIVLPDDNFSWTYKFQVSPP